MAISLLTSTNSIILSQVANSSSWEPKLMPNGPKDLEPTSISSSKTGMWSSGTELPILNLPLSSLGSFPRPHLVYLPSHYPYTVPATSVSVGRHSLRRCEDERRDNKSNLVNTHSLPPSIQYIAYISSEYLGLSIVHLTVYGVLKFSAGYCTLLSNATFEADGHASWSWGEGKTKQTPARGSFTMHPPNNGQEVLDGWLASRTQTAVWWEAHAYADTTSQSEAPNYR